MTDTQNAREAIAHHGVVRRGAFAVGDVVETLVVPEWRARDSPPSHLGASLAARAARSARRTTSSRPARGSASTACASIFAGPAARSAPEQKRRVVQRVNEMIRDDYHLETRELPIDEATETGAITMAGEKYGEMVRVVSAGPSVEFCGGTHAHSTGELGMFVLIAESSIGTGVRRIEAAFRARPKRSSSARANGRATGRDAGDEAGRGRANASRGCRASARSAKSVRRTQSAARRRPTRRRTWSEPRRVGAQRVVGAVVPEADAAALRALANAIRVEAAAAA